MHFLARATVVLSFLCAIPTLLVADTHTTQILRTYPCADGKYVPVKTSIGVTVKGQFRAGEQTILVTGSLSGAHSGKTHFSADRSTLIFEPQTPFDYNESVTVQLNAVLLGGNGVAESFHFSTAVVARANGADRNAPILLQDPLPFVTPVTTTVDQMPTPGRIFISPSGNPMGSLFILDEHGALLHSSAKQGSNFTQQPNGEITYFDGKVYIGLDSNLNAIDTFRCTNEYAADGHELLVFRNGGYCILGIDTTVLDVSQFVAGGKTAAKIAYNVIETFDKDRNLIFEWRGIDHYKVTDALGQNLTDTIIDFEHANSIDVDSNGNYLFSNRHLSEVTKIDGATGNIIWRLGGTNNQFTFTNDTLHISYQHSARFLPDHHIVIFDNGNMHAVQESRAVEYVLDEAKKTATLTWQYHHSPAIYTFACGDVERLSNGNTVIGWGLQMPTPPGPPPAFSTAMSEVTPTGDLVSEMTLPFPQFSYRVMKIAKSESIAAVPISVTATDFAITKDGSSFSVLFSSAASEAVSIELFDVLGNKLQTVFEGIGTGAPQTAIFSLEDRPHGTYFCRYHSASAQSVKALQQ